MFQSSVKTILLSFPLVIISVLGAVYFLQTKDAKDNADNREAVACTQEAKQCPDGSYVGRTGSNCEFTQCPQGIPSKPQVNIDTSNWKTYTNTKYNFSFKFPTNLIVQGGDGYEYAEKDLPVAREIYLLAPNKEVGRSANHDFGFDFEFNVYIYNSEEKIVVPFVDLDLREFTEKMWQLNKNEDKQDNITEIRIDGQQAYQFAIASNPGKGFTDGNLSLVLGGENTMIITSKGNSKFVIYFPISNSFSQHILSTLKFTK